MTTKKILLKALSDLKEIKDDLDTLGKNAGISSMAVVETEIRKHSVDIDTVPQILLEGMAKYLQN